MSIIGGVTVYGFITPSSTGDTYAVIDPIYGIDGLRNLDLLSDLDNIPNDRRRAGMIVGISGGTSYYKLKTEPWNYDNSDWELFSLGGGNFTGGTVTGYTIFTGGLSATTVETDFFTLKTSGDTNGYFLISDPNGNASWVPEQNLNLWGLIITGVTWDGQSNKLDFYKNDNTSITQYINSFSGLTVSDTLSATTVETNSLITNSVTSTTLTTNFFQLPSTGNTSGYLLSSDSNGNASWISEQDLTLWNLVVTGNKLLNGGASYVSGLTFSITPLNYIINSVIYEITGQTFVTLNSGDTTYGRIDVIVADISGNTGFVEGTPSPNPEKPDIDESTQVEVTFVSVPANASTPNITTELIYNENDGPPSEWLFSTNNPTRIKGNSTNQFYSGTKSIELSGVTSSTSIINLSSSTQFDTSQYSTLQFAIKNRIPNNTTNQLRFTFRNVGGAQIGNLVIMNAANTAGYIQYSSTNTSTWQLISIPLWKFALTNTIVNSLQIQIVNSSTNQSNLFLDKIELVEGIVDAPPTNSWINVRGDTSTIITAPSPNATLTISGGTNIGSRVIGTSVVLDLDNNINLNNVKSNTISATTFNGGFLGTSGNCFTDLFVSNVNSCSPLHIQNNSVGDVLIGENGGVNLGVGTSTPTSKLEVKGLDSSSSNYGLKVQNSGGTDNFVVRNDGNVGINSSNPNYQLEVLPKDLTGTTIVHIKNYSTSPNWAPVGLYVRDGSNYGVDMTTSSDGVNTYLNINSGTYSYLTHAVNGSSVAELVTAGSNLLLWRLPDTFNFRRRTTNGDWINFNSLNQRVSIFNENIGGVTIPARLGLRGDTDTSSSYSLVIQNSGGTNNFVVRDDGNVGVGISTPIFRLHVLGDSFVDGDVTITGNVNILGTATTINTETLTVADNIITLNSNYSGNTQPFFGNSGVEVLRGSGTTASLLWEELDGYWVAGLSGSTKKIILENDSLSLLNSGHTHPISEINNLQSSLDSKFDKSGGTISGNVEIIGSLSATTYYGNGQYLSGIVTDNFYVTGGTFSTSGSSGTLILNRQNGSVIITGFTSSDTYVTGFTYTNNNLTLTRNEGKSPLTVNISTMTGLTINGNLTVTGSTSVRGITGTSALFSGTGQNILTIIGSGNSTTSPLFTVQGSSGELFSVTDSLVGSLFSVNDISGLPILEVFSNNTILQGSYLAPSLNTTIRTSLTAGTNTVYSIPTSAYTGAFFDYTVISSTGARAGNIMSIWSGTTVQYTDVSTNDIGNTAGVTFLMSVSSGNAILSSSATTTGWTLKTIVRSI
jgi:hypothetical protein